MAGVGQHLQLACTSWHSISQSSCFASGRIFYSVHQAPNAGSDIYSAILLHVPCLQSGTWVSEKRVQNEAGLAESLQETPQKEKGKPYAAGQRERDTGKEQTSFRLPWPSGRDHPPQCLQVDLLNDTGAQLPPTGFFNEYLLHGSCETPLLCCSHLSGWSFLGSLFSRATKTKICLRKLPFCFV